MADPIIKIKRSAVPGKIPTTISLPIGEFAINTYDGKVYIQQDQGEVGVGSTVIVVNPWSVGLGSNTYNTFFTNGNVGIGTTNAQSALDVVGDVKISNNVYVDTIRRSTDNSTNTKIVLDAGSLKLYAGNGVSPKLTLNGGVGINTNLNVTGIISAISGFNLGISSAGTPITSGPITTLNFVGAGNTFAVNGTTVDISIAGGGGNGGGEGASVSIGADPPENPNEGDLWYSSVLGRTFIYYIDEDSAQWVDASPFNIPEPDSTPGKTSGTFFATEGQTVFNYTYKPGFIDVFLNGIRLNSTEFIAGNGTSIALITPASANDVLDVVEYTMGIGDTGPQGPGGPLEGIIETTSNEALYPLIVTGIGTTLPFITTTSNYFEFNPSSGTLTTNQLNIVGVVTASAFFGDGSGLTGAGSTVADDTSTDETFFPVFTQQTSGTITDSKVSTTKLTFNPSTGTLTATDINSTSDINLKESIRPIENPLDKVLQINGVEFDWKDNQQSSMGVIAQEIEKVFPSLVKTAENKSVNYNGLVGVLIEAVKEQQEQINTLKEEIRLLKEK
jgi:hypothetical protein